ncbi:hypothetical protein EOT10_04365 [Streptomyces antnestii]|uniref:Uncharacterized protein n=1 Tax=Streptomyces antnestii TaxID=2494256 RepID=A0A437Q3M0_9ACTN|nr:hypothetical protein EOT10_04365 [Streptomyces sp. San01]
MRASCTAQSAVGCAVAPRIRMRRVERSMTATTYRRAAVRVRVSKRSQASSAWAWLRRKSAQVVLCRSGAGGMPCSRRISQTVEAATLMPRASRSPWIRRYPHELFSRDRRSTSFRTSATVAAARRSATTCDRGAAVASESSPLHLRASDRSLGG